MSARTRIALLGVAVGLVLADSSVVTIALPEILTRYDVEIETLSWPLTSFNLALALSALPAAFAARRWPRPVFAGGAVAFAAASIACAAAPSFEVLVAARTAQGVAGAAVVCAALGLLASVTGADARAARIWALAGIAGAALGPAAGGVLTQLFGWESIFAVQAPIALLALAAVVGLHPAPSLQPLERPHLGANLALLLLSGALVAALFLLALLLINGWRLEPLGAGLVLTVMPVAAILAARWSGRVTPGWARAAAGTILVSGGLAALAWLPEAGAAWTMLPQVFVGVGLGLALSALTERALAGRSAQAVHGGWTIAARHAGVVLGLLLLTPIFTADLEAKRDDAYAAGTAQVLDSRIAPLEKLSVAGDILVAVEEADAEARVPDIREVIDEDGAAYEDLATSLQDQLDRAVTNAFSRSFLVAALLGLAALLPLLLDRREAAV